MAKHYELIGKQIDKKRVHITSDMLNRIESAVEGWQSFNERDVVPKFFLGTLGEHQKLYKKLQIKPHQHLHCRETILTCDPVRVGDVIEVETILKDMYEQQATLSPLGFVITEVWAKKDDLVVFHTQRIITVRGGFARGGL